MHCLRQEINGGCFKIPNRELTEDQYRARTCSTSPNLKDTGRDNQENHVYERFSLVCYLTCAKEQKLKARGPRYRMKMSCYLLPICSGSDYPIVSHCHVKIRLSNRKVRSKSKSNLLIQQFRQY